jgi:CPA2 family monovalent cation:H+ antiporter-2
MQIPLLYEIFVLLGASVVVVLICFKLKIPSILGLLITGVIIGPYGLGIQSGSHEVEMLAEIGVILLLFIIGLEFSLKSLYSIKKIVFIGGSFQVLTTILVTAVILYLFNFNIASAVFIGFLVSLSSTAIVLKMLQESGAVSSPQGRIAMGVLIFQDIIVVPMILFTPLLAGKSDNIAIAILILFAKITAILLLLFIGAKYIVPRLLFEVAKTKSKELFILTIVVICVSTAWLTNQAGLSLALGAFLAGLIISESDYSHQATGNILPFREVFSSIFFVSIGMLLDVKFLFNHFLVISTLTIFVFILKASIAGMAAKVLGYPVRTIFLTGFALFQVGEFAFILSQTGISNGILSAVDYQYFIAVSILTMSATPFIINYSDIIFTKISKTFNFGKSVINKDIPLDTDNNKNLNDHIVIIGFGINGRNVALAAKNLDIPYIILEMNAETVKTEKENGQNIIYGDGISAHILEHINISNARVVVIVISDPTAINRIIANIRTISQSVHIIVRTRYITEIEQNLNLGADEVIPEEFETSIEIFSRVLYKYLVPLDRIEEIADSIRQDNYMLLSPLARAGETHKSLNLPNLNIVILTVNKRFNHITNKSIAESDIRNRFGVNIIAIRRNSEFLSDIQNSTVILKDDILYLLGNTASINKFRDKIQI